MFFALGRYMPSSVLRDRDRSRLLMWRTVRATRSSLTFDRQQCTCYFRTAPYTYTYTASGIATASIGFQDGKTRMDYCKATNFHKRLILVTCDFSWFVNTNFRNYDLPLIKVCMKKPLEKTYFHKFGQFMNLRKLLVYENLPFYRIVSISAMDTDGDFGVCMRDRQKRREKRPLVHGKLLRCCFFYILT